MELSSSRVEQGSILCIGHALLDITFRGTKEFLDEHDLKTNDGIVIDERRFQSVYVALKQQFKAEQHLPGGASQNTARAAAWLLFQSPGAVSYMGKIADDDFGKVLVTIAKETGVRAIYQYETDGTPTGCCLAILNDKQRSLAALLGAAQKFTEAHINDNWEAVQKAKVIYIEGFFLPTCLEACRILGKHVIEHVDKYLCLNLSAEYIITEHKDMLLEIMPFVDVVFGFETDALALAKAMNFRGDLKKIAAAIAGMPMKRNARKRIVVLTSGENPVVVADGPDRVFVTKVVSLPPDRVIDTNGAGDAFVGGFLAQLVRGKSVEQCVRTGCLVGATLVQRLGFTFPSEHPNLDDI